MIPNDNHFLTFRRPHLIWQRQHWFLKKLLYFSSFDILYHLDFLNHLAVVKIHLIRNLYILNVGSSSPLSLNKRSTYCTHRKVKKKPCLRCNQKALHEVRKHKILRSCNNTRIDNHRENNYYIFIYSHNAKHLYIQFHDIRYPCISLNSNPGPRCDSPVSNASLM